MLKKVLLSAFILSLACLDTRVLAQPETSDLRSRLQTLRAHRPEAVPEGSLEGIAYVLDIADRIDTRFATQAASWRRRAQQYLTAAEAGRDPYVEAKGQITNRGYISQLSTIRQGYGVYIPPDYDPHKSYPLMIVLHGGSSNGNLFLGVVLGNNMDWLTYNRHLWDDYTPRFTPDWIVVAPDGFGQVLWRWMGEQDVLDVIADVQRNYNVDANHIVLGGLSNGGVGAHNIGMRHAWRFSTVMAMAGAPSWLDYTGGRPLDEEQTLMRVLSGRELSENAFNTDYRIYHGRTDTGPMRPVFITNYENLLVANQIPHRMTWFNLGHDILYACHRHGEIYNTLSSIVRNPTPRDVHVVTGDYRANRQHWLSITRISTYPELARAHGVIDENNKLEITTSNAEELELDLRTIPFGSTAEMRVVVDGNEVYRGPHERLADALRIARTNGHWALGFLHDEGLAKKPGLSGPITDAYFGPMIHVYGTANASHTEALRKAAERGSRGWPLWLWNFQQRVVADSEVTDEMMRSAHLVLYGSPGDNSVLERVRAQLPLRVTNAGIALGGQEFTGRDLGAKFIYPNPLAPERYLIVQTGTSVSAVSAGYNLPDFVPDYVVFDAANLRSRARLVSSKRPLALGFFDSHWRLPSEGGDDIVEAPGVLRHNGREVRMTRAPIASTLPIPEAPPAPTGEPAFPPQSDPAGRVARQMSRLIQTFPNYRATVPGGTWTVDESARWSVRSEHECLDALAREGIHATLAPPRSTPVAVPVQITGPIHGVRLHSTHPDRPIELACEMALRLADIADVAKQHGVVAMAIMSTYRDHPKVSFHSLGLAIDIPRFLTRDGDLLVSRDFQVTPNTPTCQGPEPTDERARTIRAIACELAASHRFSSVLTPNYNEGHRDHFHFDARPFDPRIFVR